MVDDEQVLKGVIVIWLTSLIDDFGDAPGLTITGKRVWLLPTRMEKIDLAGDTIFIGNAPRRERFFIFVGAHFGLKVSTYQMFGRELLRCTIEEPKMHSRLPDPHKFSS